MNKKGLLLINLGSPDSTSVPDVRKYLREFLMDGRVLDIPWPIRWCVVNLAILPMRPAQSAEAYAQVWTPEGSPLVVTSRNVQQKLQQQVGDDFVVELAMRYQSPSIETAIARLQAQGVTDLLIFPLFPHYAMSSFETAVVRAQEIAARTISPPSWPVLNLSCRTPMTIYSLVFTDSLRDICANPTRREAIASSSRTAAPHRARLTRPATVRNVSQPFVLLWKQPVYRRINFPSPFNHASDAIPG